MTSFTTIMALLALQAAPVERIDADWLEGCWRGSGLGAPASECWMAAPSGRLTGVFQLLTADGGQRFSEILILDVFKDGPALRLKHFNPDLTGWEAADEFVSFALLEQRPDALILEGMEIRLQGEDQLIIDVVLGEGDTERTERFEYTRVR